MTPQCDAVLSTRLIKILSLKEITFCFWSFCRDATVARAKSDLSLLIVGLASNRVTHPDPAQVGQKKPKKELDDYSPQDHLAWLSQEASWILALAITMSENFDRLVSQFYSEVPWNISFFESFCHFWSRNKQHSMSRQKYTIVEGLGWINVWRGSFCGIVYCLLDRSVQTMAPWLDWKLNPTALNLSNPPRTISIRPSEKQFLINEPPDDDHDYYCYDPFVGSFWRLLSKRLWCLRIAAKFLLDERGPRKGIILCMLHLHLESKSIHSYQWSLISVRIAFWMLHFGLGVKYARAKRVIHARTSLRDERQRYGYSLSYRERQILSVLVSPSSLVPWLSAWIILAPLPTPTHQSKNSNQLWC